MLGGRPHAAASASIAMLHKLSPGRTCRVPLRWRSTTGGQASLACPPVAVGGGTRRGLAWGTRRLPAADAPVAEGGGPSPCTPRRLDFRSGPLATAGAPA